MRIRCRTGGKKKKKKTAPNEIAQLTDYVISRTNNVLRFWFVVKIKLKRRGLPDTDQAEKKSWSRDGLEEREVVSTTNPIYSHWSLFSATNRHSVSGLSTKRKERPKTSS